MSPGESAWHAATVRQITRAYSVCIKEFTTRWWSEAAMERGTNELTLRDLAQLQERVLRVNAAWDEALTRMEIHLLGASSAERMLQAAAAVLQRRYGALRGSNQALSGLELMLHDLVDNCKQTAAGVVSNERRLEVDTSCLVWKLLNPPV